jgi:hypothetical protein
MDEVRRLRELAERCLRLARFVLDAQVAEGPKDLRPASKPARRGYRRSYGASGIGRFESRRFGNPRPPPGDAPGSPFDFPEKSGPAPR